MVALGELTSSHNAIPRSNYLFGPSWPHVRRTLLVAMERDGDPYAVMVRFYYGSSTRLAQALFFGEYDGPFNADRSGVFQEGVVRCTYGVGLKMKMRERWRVISALLTCSEKPAGFTRAFRFINSTHQFNPGPRSSAPMRFPVRRPDNRSRRIFSHAKGLHPTIRVGWYFVLSGVLRRCPSTE